MRLRSRRRMKAACSGEERPLRSTALCRAASRARKALVSIQRPAKTREREMPSASGTIAPARAGSRTRSIPAPRCTRPGIRAHRRAGSRGASGAGRLPGCCGRLPRPVPVDPPRSRRLSPAIGRHIRIEFAERGLVGARSLHPRWSWRCRAFQRLGFARNTARRVIRAASGGRPCERRNGDDM